MQIIVSCNERVIPAVIERANPSYCIYLELGTSLNHSAGTLGLPRSNEPRWSGPLLCCYLPMDTAEADRPADSGFPINVVSSLLN